MTPEQLAEYKKNQKSPIGVDKMNGLTKGKYVELKRLEKLKDTDIAKMYKITPARLISWKTKIFTPDELKVLNLPKRVQKADVTKTIQSEVEPVETENTTSQNDVKAEYEKTINELKSKLQTDRNKYAEAIEKYIHEKELAYQKAQQEHEQYLDTLEKLKKTDYELQNVNQRIKELESERDQLKLDFEKATALLNPLIKVVKIAL